MEAYGLVALALPAAVVVAAAFFVTYSLKRLLKPQDERPPIRASELSPEDKKAKKRKPKEKKAANANANGQAVRGESKSPKSPKKSPAEEKPKAEKKPKAPEPEPKEKKAPAKKEPRKPKQKEEAAAPDDFDDGDWEKVPSKSDKKNRKKEDEKKESPKKKSKDGKKDAEAEPAPPPEPKPAPITKELQEQILELQHALNEAEKRERSQTPIKLNETPVGSAPATPDVRSKKKKTEEVDAPPPKTQKPAKKQSSDESVETPDGDAGGEDTWTDAKKKGKKKPRKDQ